MDVLIYILQIGTFGCSNLLQIGLKKRKLSSFGRFEDYRIVKKRFLIHNTKAENRTLNQQTNKTSNQWNYQSAFFGLSSSLSTHLFNVSPNTQFAGLPSIFTSIHPSIHPSKVPLAQPSIHQSLSLPSSFCSFRSFRV